MATPDITIGEQVVTQSVAGEYAAAKTLVDNNWPDSLLQTVVATVVRALENYQATSVTSHNLDATSPKTFALNSAVGWLAGYPVRIMDTSDPDGRFMDGHVQTNMTDANCTISITSVTGSPSGPYTSWRLLLMASATTPASSPGTLAEGCWGVNMATSPASGRDSVQVPRVIKVDSIESTVPGSPMTGDIHLAAATTGAWTENRIYEYNGSSWDETIPTARDFAVFTTESDLAVYAAGVNVGNCWSGSHWRWVGMEGVPQKRTKFSYTSADSPKSLTNNEHHGGLIQVNAGGGDVTITLPLVASSDLMDVIIFRSDTSGNTVTINVAGGGDIASGGSLVSSLTPSARGIYSLVADAATYWWVTASG
jgi:hypothetical protein